MESAARGDRPPYLVNQTWRKVGRYLLRLVVIAAFGGAIFAAYTIVVHSGVLNPVKEEKPPVFADVPATNPRRAQIEEMAASQLIPGLPNGYWLPADPMTRGSFAEVVVKLMKWPVRPDEVQPFGDVKGGTAIDQADSIAVAYNKGVMGGAGGNPPRFLPNDNVTLAQVIKTAVLLLGDQITKAQKLDAVVSKLKLSDDTKLTLQTAIDNGLLAGVGIDVRRTSFSAPATREQIAAILANVRSRLPEA